MKHVLFRLSAVCVATLLLVAVRGQLRAQTAPETTSAKPASPEDLSQNELLRAYLQLRDQLHTTQLAIATSRAEAEAASRAQAAALAEKVDSIKSAMAAERDRQQAERERQQVERERQQAEAQRTNQMVLWIAGAFGGVGILAMLLMPIFQMRTINRMAEMSAGRPQLAAPASQALLPAEAPVPSDHPVSTSSQRLLSVIDRMEQRIIELEHTASSTPPKPAVAIPAPLTVSMATSPTASAASTASDGNASRRTSAANDQATWIAVLMNKARTLLGANKVLEAVACYDEILKLDRRHSDAMINKGAALERVNRFEEAIECYDHAIAANQKLTLAYLHKAAACNRAGRYQDAVECFELALQLEEKETKTTVPV
jgi:tetratricopeptide (TPR) repeat protein